MNWVDLVVLGVAALSALFGFARGLVREVLGVGAWIGAIGVTALTFDWASAKARTMIADPEIADAAAIAVVFLLTLIILSLVASRLGTIVRHSALGGLDRTLGLAFGLARAAVFVILAYIVIGLVEVPTEWPSPVLEARGLPYAYDAASWAARLLPPRYRPHVAPPPASGAAPGTTFSQTTPNDALSQHAAPDPSSPSPKE